MKTRTPVAGGSVLNKGGDAPFPMGDDGDDKDKKNSKKKGDDEEEEETEKSLSSDIDGDDLEKSLEALEAHATSGDTKSRKDQLLSKAMSEVLSKSENDELYAIMGGQVATPEPTEEALTKGLIENAGLKKALDVSEYLEQHHVELIKSLDAVGANIAANSEREHEFNIILAKAVHHTGVLVKSMSEQLGMVAAQPAHAPMSKGVRGGKPLQKSFAGQPAGDQGGNPGGQSMSRQDVNETISNMLQKSMEEGRAGRAACGEDLTMAGSRYEQTGELSKGLAKEIAEFARQQNAQ